MFSRQAICLLSTITVLGCADAPSGPLGEGAAQPATGYRIEANTAVTGDLVSVWLEVDDARATAHLGELIDRGGRFAASAIDGSGINAVVPRSALDELRRLPWLRALSVASEVPNLPSDFVPWGIDSIDADVAQSLSANVGAGVKVALIDNGVVCSHPDLAGRVVGGYDYWTSSSNYCAGGDHGTGSAGIIAASADGQGIVGVAPGASIYSLRVCGEQSEGCSSQSTAYIAAAIDWAIANQMDVIAAIVSICSNNNPAGIAAAQQRAMDAGIVTVFPAGNGAADGCTNAPYPPSGYLGGPRVIGVTAVRKSFSGTLESPSNYQYGTTVDFAAPTEVVTTSPAGGTFTFAGTSAAAPHVAGLAALLVKAGYRGHDAILFRLQYGARHVPSGGRNDYLGYGFVNSIGSLINRPSAVSIEGAPPPITTAGTYYLTAPIAFGAGPSNVKWRIVYSNGVLPTVETGFVSSPYALQVPSGSYSITVTATPKESAYLQRTGAGYQTDIPVCTGGAGSSPDAPGGCGGGGGEEM